MVCAFIPQLKLSCGLSAHALVKEALDVLDKGTWSHADLMLYEKALDTERVARSVMRTAKEDGIAEGKLEEKIEIAKNLLANGISINIICKATGLKPEEVKALL